MAQDPIGDLKKKRQREQQEKEMSSFGSARDSTPDYRNMSKVRKETTAKDTADYKSGFEKASSGRAENFPNRAEKYGQNEASHRGLRGLSAQSAEHKSQNIERPDTPLAATPEPQKK